MNNHEMEITEKATLYLECIRRMTYTSFVCHLEITRINDEIIQFNAPHRGPYHQDNMKASNIFCGKALLMCALPDQIGQLYFLYPFFCVPYLYEIIPNRGHATYEEACFHKDVSVIVDVDYIYAGTLFDPTSSLDLSDSYNIYWHNTGMRSLPIKIPFPPFLLNIFKGPMDYAPDVVLRNQGLQFESLIKKHDTLNRQLIDIRNTTKLIDPLEKEILTAIAEIQK